MPPLVSAPWLAARLKRADAEKPPILLDASWFMPATGRSGRTEFAAGPRLPRSRFFDIDAIADTSVPLPHMLPTPGAFSAAMDALGVEAPSSPVVVFDRAGIFSAPRAWFTFLALGHAPGAVSVLDGGLPAYAALVESQAGVPPLETGPVEDEAGLDAPGRAAAAAAAAAGGGGRSAPPSSHYPAALQPALVRGLDDILAGVRAGSLPLLLDARPAGRFAGSEPEPRAGLRSGHIPGAASLPFSSLLVRGEADGVTRFRSVGELRAAFKSAAGWDPAEGGAPVVFSCGTGVTACILALGAAVVAADGTGGGAGGGPLLPSFAVYDGSWTEWAGRADTPKVPEGGGVLAE
jgi:thiosulfate/3-mercaptopyruvate sulfurtransferase